MSKQQGQVIDVENTRLKTKNKRPRPFELWTRFRAGWIGKGAWTEWYRIGRYRTEAEHELAKDQHSRSYHGLEREYANEKPK